MKWTGVMELRGPMRTFKVEPSGRLSEPRQLRNGSIRDFPVDFKSDGLCVCPDSTVSLCKNFGKSCNTLSISCQGRWSGFVRPVLHTQRCMPRVVEMKRVGHVYVRNGKPHWC